MIKEELLKLMPRNKDDAESAKHIVSLGYQTVEPVVNEMLHWLRTVDSPVANVFSAFFSENGRFAVETVNIILMTSKLSVLKYAIVTKVITHWPSQTLEGLVDSLFMLAANSSEPETALKAMELLLMHDLGERDWLKQWLDFITDRLERNSAEAHKLRKTYF